MPLLTFNKKYIILVLSLFLFVIGYAQNGWNYGKLILKSGETKKGFIKLPVSSASLVSLNNKKLKYKKSRSGKVIKYDDSRVSKIYIGGNLTGLGYYEYVYTSAKKKELLKLIIDGKVKLYTKQVRHSTYIYDPNQGIHTRRTEVTYEKEYFVKRKYSRIAENLVSAKDLVDFKTKSLEYFKDCPKILYYLNNDLYDETNVRELIDDYNLICE